MFCSLFGFSAVSIYRRGREHGVEETESWSRRGICEREAAVRTLCSELPEDLSDGEEPGDGILHEESLRELANALSALDERSRTLIIFRYYRQLSLKETAERLGISYAYVKILHRNALRALRLKLE